MPQPNDADGESEPTAPGTLLVISGPSGVGKSTIVEALKERRRFEFSVSVTTRAPRHGEVDGVDYRFVDDATFDGLVARHELLEWATYGGNRYGTPAAALVAHLDAGKDVLLDIENWGARQVKSSYPDAVTVFIVPPTLEELERRLKGRGDTNPTAVVQRLAAAAEQIADASEHYDAVVVGDRVERATDEIMRILAAHEEGSNAR